MNTSQQGTPPKPPMSSKRVRAASNSSSPSSGSPSSRSANTSLSAMHISKASRVLAEDQPYSFASCPLVCTLPPTCNTRPTAIADSFDLERHYAHFHAHVCELDACGCVFPEARLLDLHQTECHDPIAALRKDRGEKIFACHLASCPRVFQTPKTRRLHLIQAHGFPKEYFFAVTNKGVGGLLKRWGEGASMIRKEWKPRETAKGELGSDEDKDEDESDTDAMDADEGDNTARLNNLAVSNGVGMDADEMESDETEGGPPDGRRHQSRGTSRSQHRRSTTEGADTLEGLADSMNSLSLVPQSIRFGRGGKNGGFTYRGAHQQTSNNMNTKNTNTNTGGSASPGSDTRGGRGRGQGSQRGAPPVLRSRGRGRGVGVGRAADAGNVSMDVEPSVAASPSHSKEGSGNSTRGRGAGRAGIIHVNLDRGGSPQRGRGRGRGGRGRGVVVETST